MSDFGLADENLPPPVLDNPPTWYAPGPGVSITSQFIAKASMARQNIGGGAEVAALIVAEEYWWGCYCCCTYSSAPILVRVLL